VSERPCIMVMTPCYGSHVMAAYTESILRLQVAFQQKGIGFAYKWRDNDALITRARAEMVAGFLADPVATRAMERLRPVFDWKRPTALFIGRFQPFHEGHRALIVEGLRRVGQVCVAVRDTHDIDDKNPYDFENVKVRIEHALRAFEGRFTVVLLPNITHVFYGRDVGYVLDRIELDKPTEEISATELRRKSSAG